MFDSGIRIKTTTQRWCFPDRSSNLVLAACVFQQWFLIAAWQTFLDNWVETVRVLVQSHATTWNEICFQSKPHAKEILLRLQLKANSVVTVQAHKPAGEICSGFQTAHFPHLRSTVTPHREKSGTFPDSGGRSSQLSCCRPSVTW